MLDSRKAWRSRINMIVAANLKVDSSKKEESKIRRIKTRSAIVVSYYNLIELRDILSRDVAVEIDFCFF
jgi:hypothetical protein